MHKTSGQDSFLRSRRGRQNQNELLPVILWLANYYFADDSSRFPVLLRFSGAQPCRSFHPLHCCAGPLARTSRFQDLFQQPSHAYVTGRAYAADAGVKTSRQSPLVSVATTLSSLLSDTGSRVTCPRLALAAVSGQRRQKLPIKSFGI
jgi:hypothetical protein